LAEPFPAHANNAALNYQRALLQLAMLDDSRLEPLSEPIWEALPQPADKGIPREIGSLLSHARFAINSATTATRTAACNFGIDFSDGGAATQLPHVEGMVQLGRLLTLRGALAEAQGEWEEAVIIYFDGLRMGRHLAGQNTLLEALAGVEILRNNYYALASWAARCPARLLVARAFGLLESMQAGLVDPARVIAREASIMALDFERLENAYPDGNWPQLILDSYGEEVTGKAEEDRSRAIAACTERGVPKEVFESIDAFEAYVAKLQATCNRFVESVAACMVLPPKARLKRASALNKKYAKVIPVLSSDTLIDPAEIGKLFAQHEAELALARIALAVSASKSEGKFPKSLESVASRFGGVTPKSPYSGQTVEYQLQDDGSQFSLQIPSLGPLPYVGFNSRPPTPAE
jgi:hypothetical protein